MARKILFFFGKYSKNIPNIPKNDYFGIKARFENLFWDEAIDRGQEHHEGKDPFPFFL